MEKVWVDNLSFPYFAIVVNIFLQKAEQGMDSFTDIYKYIRTYLNHISQLDDSVKSKLFLKPDHTLSGTERMKLNK